MHATDRYRHVLLALALGLSLGGGRVHAAASRPNIVLFLTDDQGYGDFGFTGNPVLETPHLDRLAAQSAVMESFYVAPVCSPTRAGLMTGRYHYRTRVVDTYKGRSMMDPAEVTVAELLRDAGYTTGIFGKWHLGDEYPLRPNDQGFDEALVLRGGGLAQPSEPIENARRYTNPILFRNDRPVQTQGFCTDVYVRAALDFMDTAHKRGRPFFTYLATNAPHGPFHDVPAALYRKYRARDLSRALTFDWHDADVLARVFAMEENIDQNIGRLLAFLDEHGLAENTLLIFMVDNGPAGRRYVGPFRGKKGEVHDGGIRSPFLARWPARLRAGTRSDRIAAYVDVLPTLLDAAGVTPPRDLRLDGRSLLPLLEGRDVVWPDRALVLQVHRGDRPRAEHHMAVRSQRWKLVHPTGFGRETMPPGVPFELYDIPADPGERHNLAASQPEVVQHLRDAYAAWFQDVSSARPDFGAPPRIVIGSDRDTTTTLTPQDWRVTAPQGWGRHGHWLLRAERDAVYDVTLRWPAPIEPATLHLRAGATDRTVPLKAAQDRVVIEAVPIAQGELTLSVDVVRGEDHEDPYQVILVRR